LRNIFEAAVSSPSNQRIGMTLNANIFGCSSDILLETTTELIQ